MSCLEVLVAHATKEISYHFHPQPITVEEYEKSEHNKKHYKI